MSKKTAQRNIIADSFFECVSAFTRRTGAADLDSKAEYVSGKREKGLMRMTCRADYGKFIIVFSYTAVASAPGGVPSVLDISVILEPHNPWYVYSLYELMYLLEPDNFRCFRFSNIETPDRMKKCFSSIEGDLERYLPRFAAIASESGALENARAKLIDGVRNYCGYNAFEQLGDKHSDAEYAIERYYNVYHIRFDSEYYAAFLRGDYNKALKLYGKAKNKTFYEVRLISFMQSLAATNMRYSPVEEGCDPLNEGLKTVNLRSGFALLLGTALALWIPMSLLCIGVYYLAALLIYNGALYSEAYEFTSALMTCSVALLPALVCSFYMYRAGIYLMPKKKREKYAAFDRLNSRRSNGCVGFVNIAAAGLALYYIFTFANVSTAYYDGYFRYCTSPNSSGAQSVPYSDIDCVVHSQGEYDVYGKWVEYEAYYIMLNNRDSYAVSASVGVDKFEEKVLPLLESRGIKVVEVKDAGYYIDAGTKK